MRRIVGALLTFAVAAACAPRDREIVLASTTSVDDSGLLEAILPAYHEAHPEYQVKVIAVGSGEALALAERGDADIVIAHSPDAEARFMEAGHGRARVALMGNDFIIVGPAPDPAQVRGLDAVEATGAISRARVSFVSRGDNSGTHARERSLLKQAGIAGDTTGAWYMSIGQGMGEALRVASERQAYTLSDRATFTALRANLQLDVLVEGDGLENVYSVITTVRGRNHDGADALASWLTGRDGQARIGAFGRERFGRALFEPLAH